MAKKIRKMDDWDRFYHAPTLKALVFRERKKAWSLNLKHWMRRYK